jgi:hypothetical protein
VHLLEKSVINMIRLRLPVLDWPIIMIGPGGLHLFAAHVSVLCVGLQKSKELNLDVRNFFAGSHTEQLWGCSKII